ncbi:MAG: hypothetical protein AABX61_03815 [Nanoarchaeota archaeon]
METVSYPLRIPGELMELAKLKSKEQYMDQATALRQLLYMGAEKYVLELLREGRISAEIAARLLKVNIHEIYRIAEKYNIKLGATLEQYKKGLEKAKNLFK